VFHPSSIHTGFNNFIQNRSSLRKFPLVYVNLSEESFCSPLISTSNLILNSRQQLDRFNKVFLDPWINVRVIFYFGIIALRLQNFVDIRHPFEKSPQLKVG